MAFLGSSRGLAPTSNRERQRMTEERKQKTLEESFRGHYKRRAAETTHQVSLPFVVGKDHLAYTRRLKRSRSEQYKNGNSQKHSPEKLFEQGRRSEELIWKVDSKSDISLRKRVIKSLEDKNKRVLTRSDASSHSSSTSDFLSESDSGESTDEERKFDSDERQTDFQNPMKARKKAMPYSSFVSYI